MESRPNRDQHQHGQQQQNNPSNSPNYVAHNNVPMGASHYKGRVFLTVPRRRVGVPSTLNFVYTKSTKGSSPSYKAFPNIEMNQLHVITTILLSPFAYCTLFLYFYSSILLETILISFLSQIFKPIQIELFQFIAHVWMNAIVSGGLIPVSGTIYDINSSTNDRLTELNFSFQQVCSSIQVSNRFEYIQVFHKKIVTRFIFVDNATQVQRPSIWAYDLERDVVVHRFEIPQSVVERGNGLASITVDVDANNCQNAYAYIPDLAQYRLYVYRFATFTKCTIFEHLQFMDIKKYHKLSFLSV